MCGIFGYVGASMDLGPVVLDALRTLEYRGYDSWGVAVGDGSTIRLDKQIGKIGGASVDLPASSIGFGHTRWATHGGVTRANAHPHLDPARQVAIIHNGIVDNFRALRDELIEAGHVFVSETDSEVIAHLVGEQIAAGVDLLGAVATTVARLEGFNAVIAMQPATGEMVATKNVSPLVVGVGPTGTTLASDALALAPHADRVMFLDDHQIIRLRGSGIELFDGAEITPMKTTFVPFDMSGNDSGRGAYSTFMAKEMAEQPDVIERLATSAEEPIRALVREIEAASETVLVGCGTAYYAALAGAQLLGEIAGRRMIAISGSEFRYQAHLLSDHSLVIALSQSGETADLIEAMLSARARGARLAAMVNVRNSTLDRMVDVRVHLGAGPEQCVLSTKAYTAKVAALVMIATALAGGSDDGSPAVRRAAAGMRTVLDDAATMSTIVDVAERVHRSPHLFVIGRGVNYPTALEAALKIKEVSYIHAEGFAGGELKHGVIALIESGTPCLVIAPDDATRTDILSGAMELKCRGGHIIGIGSTSDPVFDDFIAVPDVGVGQPLVNVLPAQLLGYHCALKLGYDPDKPRNLAKSVTVK